MGIEVADAAACGFQKPAGVGRVEAAPDGRCVGQGAHRAGGGQRPHLSGAVGRTVLGGVGPVGAVLLQAGRVAKPASLGLDREQTFEVIGQVDDYVFGYSLREVQEAAEQENGWSPAVWEPSRALGI